MRVDGVAQADEQAFQVVLAGFLDLAALDADEIEHDLFLLLQLVQVKAQRPHVGDQLGARFPRTS